MLDDEEFGIDFGKLLRLVLKRWRVVVALGGCGALLGGLFGVSAQRAYQLSTIIAPPSDSVESIENMTAKIQEGAFDADIIRQLANPAVSELRFQFAQPKNTQILWIGLRVKRSEIAVGLAILNSLLDKLRQSYAKAIDGKRSELENQIRSLTDQIATTQNEIKLRNDQLKILQEREDPISVEAKEAKDNSEKLLAQRQALLDRRDARDDISALLYTSTIQQNISYFMQLQNQMADIRTQQKTLLSGIESLKSEINAAQTKIRSLSLLKNSVQNIAVVQPPVVSSKPVGPSRILFLLISAAFGLLAGIGLAAALEYHEP